jgi:hypothetical protein
VQIIGNGAGLRTTVRIRSTVAPSPSIKGNDPTSRRDEAPNIILPAMMPDKNSKKYQWDKKLTASFNFEGSLEVAAAATALAQGREDLISGSDGNLPSWYRNPAKTGRDGSAKIIDFYRPKDQPKTPRIRYYLGITENSKDKQGNKIGISLEYTDLFKIARVMEEAALAILGWRKEIEGQREPNGRDRQRSRIFPVQDVVVFSAGKSHL